MTATKLYLVLYFHMYHTSTFCLQKPNHFWMVFSATSNAQILSHERLVLFRLKFCNRKWDNIFTQYMLRILCCNRGDCTRHSIWLKISLFHWIFSDFVLCCIQSFTVWKVHSQFVNVNIRWRLPKKSFRDFQQGFRQPI